MSMSPPPGYPPGPPPTYPPQAPSPGYAAPPPAGFPAYSGPTPLPTGKTGFFGQLKTLAWWEKVLVALPLTLVPIGGLIGGLCGAGASVLNTRIARSGMSVAVRASLMLAVTVAAYIAYFIIASIIVAAIRPAGR